MAVEIAAHRGASGEAPENTLAAVRLAWTQLADAVEIDVRMTRDGKIVAFHDENTLRITGQDRVIAETSFAELQTLDAGHWKGEEWGGERIPSLEAVLATVPPGKRLFVEIKCGREILPELVRILKRPLVCERVVVIGYGFEVLAELKRLQPAATVLQVLRLSQNPQNHQEATPGLTEWIGPVKNAGLNGFDLGITRFLESSTVEQLLAEPFQIAAWTVNEADEARRLRAMGVQAMTTDFPARLRRELALPDQVPEPGEPGPLGM